MVCYRQHDHTTADDAKRYEPKNLREAEWIKEPISRLKIYLEKQGMLTESMETEIQTECSKMVDSEVHEYLNTHPQSLTSMIEYVYKEWPHAYQAQREILDAMEEA